MSIINAQIAKDLVLAGVGSLTIVDDASVAARDPNNFLINIDADESQRCEDENGVGPNCMWLCSVAIAHGEERA